MPRKIAISNPRLFLIDPKTGKETEIKSALFAPFMYQLDLTLADFDSTPPEALAAEIEAQITKVDPFVFELPPDTAANN